ncbi:33 kDa chaperonin [Pullulanibacillus camelliae]|uniref:33 kDa chaperonin n=1 Tax=Pullulanibacillus camelliae TaxID=1707096 RepID=A0A8J2YMN7_9BACL|nr:Hsp33 family molecular chaperone HslO [Pullulanibacillus camelliae]GGE54153.1 33 kDa chaperonin [Pullulanibacillus camelliae]
MKDYLVKALAYDGNIRVQAIRTTNMVGEAQRRHNVWPTASAALGRTMTATTMLAAQLKGEDKMTVTIEGGGPIGAIIVDANAKGETRGYLSNPHVHFDLNKWGKLDVARAVGTEGYLSVIKDLGLKENFTGRVPLVSGEIGDDFTYYLAHSEQVPSAVGVGVLVNPDNSIKAAGGFLIQLLPGVSDEVITKVEKRLSEISTVSQMIDQGLSPEEMLIAIFGESDVKFLDEGDVKFQCRCSREAISNAIVMLGKEEIEKMITEDKGAEATCHFCNETYKFSEDELKELYQSLTD